MKFIQGLNKQPGYLLFVYTESWVLFKPSSVKTYLMPPSYSEGNSSHDGSPSDLWIIYTRDYTSPSLLHQHKRPPVHCEEVSGNREGIKTRSENTPRKMHSIFFLECVTRDRCDRVWDRLTSNRELLLSLSIYVYKVLPGLCDVTDVDVYCSRYEYLCIYCR